MLNRQMKNAQAYTRPPSENTQWLRGIVGEAQHYARCTKRDAWLIAVWVMEFHTMRTYSGRQALMRHIHAIVETERAK